MEHETKTVFVVVALKVKASADVAELVQEMEYDFRHEEIMDMEIIDADPQ